MSSCLGWWRGQCWSDGAVLWCHWSCDNWTHQGQACFVVGRDRRHCKRDRCKWRWQWHPAYDSRPCAPSSGAIPCLSTPSAALEQWCRLEAFLWALSSLWTRHIGGSLQPSALQASMTVNWSFSWPVVLTVTLCSPFTVMVVLTKHKVALLEGHMTAPSLLSDTRKFVRKIIWGGCSVIRL